MVPVLAVRDAKKLEIIPEIALDYPAYLAL
jgi:hypothetical protein